ncbi:MAG: glycosyltransferase involved in cell wall biosynthesis [Candidatus Poriferisodalaceae bacterium]|jgi:glycosyltransferase involved in cell wall biosynthesis
MATSSNLSSAAVSVVIPTYNRADLVGEAIDSVLGQSRPPNEVVVVDDGSTDATTPVLAAYGDRIRVVRQSNGGIGRARNAGLDVAGGEFLAFLDSDDIWMNNKLESQLIAFDSDPSLEAVFGACEQFYDPSVDAAFRERHKIKTDASPATLSSALLVRRSAFDRVGDFEVSRSAGVDVDWFLRARESALRFLVLDQVVYRRRLHLSNNGLVNSEEANLARVRALRASIQRRRAGAGV